MIVLPNIYTSDIQALLDWWREIKDIDAVQQSDIWNMMGRFERDLNDYKVGKGSCRESLEDSSKV